MKKRLPHRGYIPRAQSPFHLKLIFTIVGISSNLGFTRASHAEAPTGLLVQTNIFYRLFAIRRGDRVGRPPELMMYSLLHE